MCRCIIVCVLTLLFTCPFPATAQQTADIEWWVAPGQLSRPEELDQMLAPIALYPDALLAQVLAAATYPRSIAVADRFVKDNPGVPGQALIDVARDTDWSPSVKAMLLFPDILDMMGGHLDWTTKLGTAFLTQQRDVIDSVQRLRQMAYEQGRLTTTREEIVRFDPLTHMIMIEPANSQMVYVPVYDPMVVYGTWRYRDYPPQRYYYPRYSGSSTASFLAGVLVGVASGWGGWDFDWQNRRSNVRVNNYNTFVNRSYASPERFQIGSAGVKTVVYDTQFRKAAGYRDYTTAQRFSGQQASGHANAGPGVSKSRGGIQARVQPSVSKTILKGGVQSRPAVNVSVKTRPGKSTKNVNTPNGSDVSQAAHTAKSEGLKGQDLAGKVHEAIDTRKENKDAIKTEAKGKKEQGPQEKGSKEKR